MRQSLMTLVIVASPRAALACPVCFGQSDSPLALGTNMAILFMLGVTGSVLAGFAGFIFYLIRRGRLVAGIDGPADAGRDNALPPAARQKGTA
jgi:hypothetical protein